MEKEVSLKFGTATIVAKKEKGLRVKYLLNGGKVDAVEGLSLYSYSQDDTELMDYINFPIWLESLFDRGIREVRFVSQNEYNLS